MKKGKSIFSFLDLKSVKFKLWAYFLAFAVFLMLILWFLQAFLLNNYYQAMRIGETNRIVSLIISQYGQKGFLDTLHNISVSNDLYIHIEASDGTVIFTPDPDRTRRSYIYRFTMAELREQIGDATISGRSRIIHDDVTNSDILAYASYLQREEEASVILYVFAPLTPAQSTLEILRNQLVYVTLISLFLAFCLSFYLSSRITRPLREITRSAGFLAEGRYGIRFQGGSYSELIRLADTLTDASLRLEKAATLQKDLIANVSHDLKTPLTMIRSYAEMIRDLSGDNPEKRGDHLQVIIHESERLNFLVNDLLTLSKIQSGAICLEPDLFNLSEALNTVIQSYRLLSESDGYHITVDAPTSVPVRADRVRITQVLSNLISNAVKYCGKNKEIQIRIIPLKTLVRCEVSDDGMGIPPEEQELVWDRYYKASTNHIRTTTGTGLGLSIVKEILILHGASYGVRSTPGLGSTFWFELQR